MLLATMEATAAADAGRLEGRVVDDTGVPLGGVLVRLVPLSATTPPRTTHTDSSGLFELGLPPGSWQLSARAFGYREVQRIVEVDDGVGRVEVRLPAHPLVMDEMVVRARRDRDRHTGAFVESLPIGQRRASAGDLALALDRATGVNVRRYGGLGSFSTVSIRGSTAEQVAIYLDGVPLNQALGGGVDVGGLSLGGVESVDIYRGAVPARFGGNSLGGVVHIRTSAPSEALETRLHIASGSHGTREISSSVSGRRYGWQLLGLLDYSGSGNDFRFWDDNGTEYNADDDAWARRLNSDYESLRSVTKAVRPLGAARLQLHNTFDLSHRGIPGIGNNQSLHTRYDTWRSLTETLLYGPMADLPVGYRLKAYHSLEQEEYKDLRGEVGIGTQHDRNTTRALGARGELSAALPAEALFTGFAGGRHERFSPHNRLRPDDDLPASRRQAWSLGGEMEMPLGATDVTLSSGAQVERLDDRLVNQGDYGADEQAPHRSNREALWGARAGASMGLGAGWRLQGHVGRYGRPPSFFELFGDRGAVLGNSELVSEHGLNLDAGVVYRATPEGGAGLLLAEAVVYRNVVDDLIRFVQNSQRVSRPHNIGQALTRGVETRLQAQLNPQLHAEGSYVYQRAENRAPFSFERGNDLPNAPRHRLYGRLAGDAGRGRVHYELTRESRHFLDRANLRPVVARTIHGVGAGARLVDGLSLAAEIRNLTDDQVADLWGYPLPGRSWFLSLRYDLSRSST